MTVSSPQSSEKKTTPIGEQRASPRNIALWTTYDIANTIFSMGIVSVTILRFVQLQGMKEGLSYSVANFLGHAAVAASNIIVALLMPILGAVADTSGKRKPWTVLFGALTILLTGMVFLLSNVYLAIALFILANITYQGGNLFYDAMIPYICASDEVGKVSAVGVALGYFGSFLALGLWFLALGLFGDPTEIETARDMVDLGTYGGIELNALLWMWPLCALGFLVIMVPFFWTRERRSREERSAIEALRTSLQELLDTAKKIRRDRDMLLYTLGWLLCVDVVNTVIAEMLKVAHEGFGMDETEGTILLFIGVASATGLTYFIGPVCDRNGPKFAFKMVCTTWFLGLLIAILAEPVEGNVTWFTSVLPNFTLYIMAVMVGFAMGATWVAGRQMVIELAPPDDVGQYFGFNRLAGKGTSAIGILVFGAVISVFSEIYSLAYTYKIAIAAMALIYLCGFALIMLVRDWHEEFVSGRRAPYL
ncbi:MAG: MFS transporter [Candidatus Thorarchaeota archaeon]